MKSHKKHILIMILGCVLSLIFLFTAPLFGIKNSLSFFIFIVIMLGIHILFPMHGNRNNHKSADTDTDYNY